MALHLIIILILFIVLKIFKAMVLEKKYEKNKVHFISSLLYFIFIPYFYYVLGNEYMLYVWIIAIIILFHMLDALYLFKFQHIENKKIKLIKIGMFIAIASVTLFTTYSSKVLNNEIGPINSKDPIVVYKNDVDEQLNFETFSGEITSKEDKQKIMNYISTRKIKRIIVPIEPFFNPKFDKTRIMPRYNFIGYMSGFEIWGNQYVYSYRNRKYYKFIDEINIKKLDEMLKLKKYK